MNREQLWGCLVKLNTKLQQRGLLGEVGIYGGAVMCLVLDARESTDDIDAVFSPKEDIRKFISEIADEEGLVKDWLNDAVKGFVSSDNELIPFASLSNLNIYAASPEYMFAMKCLSSRMDNEVEMGDIAFLINYLNIKTTEEAERIIYKFYPQKRIMQKTFYMLMERLGNI